MKHSLVRQTIVETASQLFYANGYNLTGINEIIKEAGVAKATLYNHFKSKDDICLAYLQHKHKTFMDSINSFLKDRKGKNKVLGIFDFLEQFFLDKDFNGCWCINTVSELPKGEERVRAEIQTQKKEFISWLGTILSDSGYASESEKIANQVYLLYEGAVAESHLHQEPWPIREAKSICTTILD